MTDTAVHPHHHSIQGANQQKEETLDLVIYWRSVAKRKWAILGLAVAIAVLAGVVVSLMTPIYRSTVTLMIEQNKARVVSIEEVYNGISANREHFQTQAEILKSVAIAEKVITRLELTKHPEFDPRQQERPFWSKALSAVGVELDDQKWTDDRVMKAVVTKFTKRMTVEPVRLSQLVKVSFESANKDLAAQVANTIADVYIVNDMESRFQMTRKASDWLNSQLSGLKKNLEQSERTLQEYRERERIVDTKGLAQAGVSKQIEDLTRSMVEARAKRAEAENAYQQVKNAKGTLDSLPVVLRSPLVGRLKEVEAEAEKKVAELSNRYGKEHVKMIQAESELKQAKENTRRQVDVVVASLIKEYEVARANEQAVAATLGEAKGSIQHMNRKEFQLTALEREVQTNRQLYETFMNRFKETSASSENTTSMIARIVDPAVPAERAVRPNKQQIVLIALVLGLFLGVIVALLLERLDNTIKSSEDIEAKLGQPMLAMLPRLMGKQGKAAGQHYLMEPKSVFSEAIRTARTGVLLSAIDAERKTLVVTSSVPGEGKSTFAINLALAHAQTKKVLLLDADMRRPSVVKSLELDATRPGLSGLVSGTASLPECIQHVEGSTLHVVGAGSIPPNPLELILSHKFKDELDALQAEYDVIVIDSPPVQLVSDAVVLSTMATGVLFVVKADDTPYQVARRCVRTLVSAEASLFGVVLNYLDFQKADRYYGAYTGYSKYNYDGYYAKAT